MARKSRITEKQPPLTLRERIYKVGLYIRLSVLDSGKKDSDTLESQEDILRKFIEGKSEFSLVSVYVDNGQTGVNFERDEFERLLSDVRSGKVVRKKLHRGRRISGNGFPLYESTLHCRQ